ncbi:MAG: hypothetical protein IPK00_16220 [Deltaproteobacteria bacterium]|nr:hypothetical protein [Deltaproteobacteria bacterium]
MSQPHSDPSFFRCVPRALLRVTALARSLDRCLASALNLAGAVCLAGAFNAAPAAAGGTLSTAGQLEREVRAVALLASPPMRRAIDALEQVYRADARGKTAAGAATARRAAESTATAAAYAIVNEDAARPVVFWGANAPHDWFGISVPRAGYGIENPDNVYRSLHVDGASRYVLHGRFPENGPVELHFVVMDEVPGSSDKMPVEGAGLVATLRSDAMQIGPDGRFTITLDDEPANGRPNHLQLPKQGLYPVYVRDLFTDWSRQSPVALEAFRIAGPPAPPVEPVAKQAEAAAQRLDRMGRFWLGFNNRFLYTLAPNTLTPPRNRPGGRGLSNSGHFALADDEALVLTLDPLGAVSFGVQLADPWGVAFEYVHRTSSLNQAQASSNADGSVTFVVAARDPGVHNWLDPEGQNAGIVIGRWQVLPGEVDASKAVREVRVVKLDALRAALPPGTRFVTPAEREAQRTERARQYGRRLAQ